MHNGLSIYQSKYIL